MGNLLQSLKDLGPAKLALIGGVAVVLLGLFATLALRGGGSGSSGNMGLLYSNVAPEDGADIMAYLETNDIPYELRANGTQIFVSSEQVSKARLAMAGEGIPSKNSGVGYEIFDQSEALGTSNFVHNVNLMRALEGELSRTISEFNTISSARVHLVIPKRELFTRNQQPPSASVALNMKGGNTLNKGEVQAIRHLVASAVPGLDLEKITIVDEKGKLLAKGAGGEDDIAGAAGDADEYRVLYERRMKERLETLITKTVGENNVQVNVTADIDFDRIVKKMETFDPEGQVARSVQSSEETENEVERDADANVTVANNLPDPQAAAAGTVTQRNLSRSDETTNFEISKETINHVQEIGTVNRISVAVLINGSFKLDEESGEVSYIERPQEELDQINRLVRSAIGFDEERGDTVEVVNLRFDGGDPVMEEASPFAWLKQDFHNILQTAILGIVAILAILLVIRPLVNRAIDTGTIEDDEEEIEALIGPDGLPQLTDQSRLESELGLADEDDAMVDVANIEGGIKSSSLRRITALIDAHPEETLSVLRGWMNAEKDGGGIM